MVLIIILSLLLLLIIILKLFTLIPYRNRMPYYARNIIMDYDNRVGLFHSGEYSEESGTDDYN